MIKRVVPFGFAIAVLLWASQLLAGTTPVSIVYTIPSNGSSGILPVTAISLRASEQITSRFLNGLVVDVMGSACGAHSGTMALSDDERTIVFKPDLPFSFGESITVNVHAIAEGGAIVAHEFGFQIATGDYLPNPDEMLRRVMSEEMGIGAPVLHRDANSAFVDTLAPVVQIASRNQPTDGKIFFATFSTDSGVVPYLMIVDNDGTPMFARKQVGPAFDFKVQPTGQLSYYEGPLSRFDILDSGYHLVKTIQCANGYYTDLHELRLLPNGHALLLGIYGTKKDMSKLVKGGDTAAILTDFVMQELDTSGNAVFEFRSSEHYDVLSTTDVPLADTNLIDYIHPNAIELDTDGNYIVSCRHLDEITKVDRNTGNVLWRWGGKNNQFTTDDTDSFSHQHAVRRIANGDFVIFDNGNFLHPGWSRAVEYKVNEVSKHATLVWQFRNQRVPNDYFYSIAMGDVERLDNGHTFIGWGLIWDSSQTATEVNAAGAKELEIVLPAHSFSYRVYRANWDPSPKALGVQRDEHPIALGSALIQNYPNPFNPTTKIEFTLAQTQSVTIIVQDALGREVERVEEGSLTPGSYSVPFDASHLASGTYYYSLAGQNERGRMILTK